MASFICTVVSFFVATQYNGPNCAEVSTGRTVVPLFEANIFWTKYDVDGVRELGLESRPKRVG